MHDQDLIPRRVKTGEWDGQPIWRLETSEEVLRRVGLNPEAMRLYIALNEKITYE